MLAEEFKDGIKKLESVFGKAAQTESQRIDKLSMYRERLLHKIDSKSWSDIVENLIDNWSPAGSVRFPLPKHFFAVAKEISDKSYSDPDETNRVDSGYITRSKHWWLMASIVRKILNCHKKKVVFEGEVLEMRPYSGVYLDIPEWQAAGCPKLWSPLIDKLWSDGAGPYLLSEETGGCQYEDFLAEFSDYLDDLLSNGVEAW